MDAFSHSCLIASESSIREKSSRPTRIRTSIPSSTKYFQFVLRVVWFHHCSRESFLVVFGNPTQDVLNSAMSEIVKNSRVYYIRKDPIRMKLCFIVIVHCLQ